MVSGNYELVSVRADELDVPERRNKNELQTWINELDEEKLHCIGAFTASKGSCLTTYVHCRIAGCHRLPLCNGDLLEIFCLALQKCGMVLTGTGAGTGVWQVT